MQIKTLDHGYVEFIEDWGRGKAGKPEAGIIEAARQSTQGSFRGWREDKKLLKYLYSNRHDTPFEFAGMVLEVQAPIFVFREWHRHRTQSYNEMSARYAPLPDLYYKPTVERICINDSKQENRQAQGLHGLFLKEPDAKLWLKQAFQVYEDAEEVYQQGLRIGVPKEVARIVMPVGHYSRMRCQANLRNWLAFMTLRADPKAQYEIRQYAAAVGRILSEQFPNTWDLYCTEARRAA